MTFRSKVLARTKKYDGQTDRRTDRQTDGHPKPIGPQPFGLGPNHTRGTIFMFTGYKNDLKKANIFSVRTIHLTYFIENIKKTKGYS